MKTNFFWIGVSIIFLQSCAFHSGNVSSGYTSFDQPHKITQTVFGKAQARYFLGIGGLDHNMLVEEARKDLYRKLELPQNALLTNFTISTKHAFYFVYSKYEVYITADIIEPRSNGEPFVPFMIGESGSEKFLEDYVADPEVIKHIKALPDQKIDWIDGEPVWCMKKNKKSFLKGKFSQKQGDQILVKFSVTDYSYHVDAVFKTTGIVGLDKIVGVQVKNNKINKDFTILGYCPSNQTLLINMEKGSKEVMPLSVLVK
jgi:hypothetical protein